MKIHPNTAKTPPLLDAIDAYADDYEASRQNNRGGDWRVRMEMAAQLSVDEATITERDVRYFIRRMGPLWLARKVRGIGAVTAEKLFAEACRGEA